MITPPIDEFPAAIRHAALCLWADSVWSDDTMGVFRERLGQDPISAFGNRDILEWPMPMMDPEFIDHYRAILVSTEVAWGRSIHSIAEEIGVELDDLCYKIAMQSAGHGVGPQDYLDWPDSLDCAKITRAECPAYNFLELPEEWVGLCLVTDQDGTTHIREYAVSWGSDKGDGPLFYRWGSQDHRRLTEPEFRTLLSAIEKLAATSNKAHTKNLDLLYNHVLWERDNLHGIATDLKERPIRA